MVQPPVGVSAPPDRLRARRGPRQVAAGEASGRRCGPEAPGGSAGPEDPGDPCVGAGRDTGRCGLWVTPSSHSSPDCNIWPSDMCHRDPGGSTKRARGPAYGKAPKRRRGWDSNPRTGGCPVTSLAGRPDRPDSGTSPAIDDATHPPGEAKSVGGAADHGGAVEQRREGDSNPRRVAPQRFSRPSQSSALPSLPAGPSSSEPVSHHSSHQSGASTQAGKG